MKNIEIRSLDSGDMNVQLEKLKKELFGLRVKAATESIENPAQIGRMRRDVARILTEQRRRELEAEAKKS